LVYLPIQFAENADSGGGLGAFQLNLKDFVIQLITFVLVLLVLRKWVVPKLIVREAESRLSEEREKLRGELREELAVLVADATEKIIHEKLDDKRDMSLIERAIKGITG
jgi:F0F1-type ATP synthase membrane subunit b/b'